MIALKRLRKISEILKKKRKKKILIGEFLIQKKNIIIEPQCNKI